MKKLVVLGMGVCMVLAFASCKSSESAYKKAYEKAKQQELAEPQVEAPVEVTPVVAAPVTTPKVADTSGVRQERLQRSSGQLWREGKCGRLERLVGRSGLQRYNCVQCRKSNVPCDCKLIR